MPNLGTRAHRMAAATGTGAALIYLGFVPLAPTARAAPASGVVAPPAEILSNYEVATGHTLDRDCGYTVPVLSPYHPSPGEYPVASGTFRPAGAFADLWLFCDTVDYNASGTEVGAILGTDTAAEGPLVPGQVPQDLSELPTPPARAFLPSDSPPSPFLPVPSGLVQPGSTSACVGTGYSPTGVYGPASPGIYPASWIDGAAREPAGFGNNPLDVLLSFSNYCVDAETGNINTLFTDEGFGLVSYDPLANRLGDPVYVFDSNGGTNLPRQEQLGDPIFFEGYLYLFAFNCNSSAFGTCLSGVIYMARVPAVQAAWDNASDYQWWTGSGWSSNYLDAGNLVPSATPLGISVGDYSTVGRGFLLIAETNLVGAFQVFTAPTPVGPWTLLKTGQVPSTCSGGEFGCYALIGHPELSTPSELLLSYYDPAGVGHLHLAAFPWASSPSGEAPGRAALPGQSPG